MKIKMLFIGTHHGLGGKLAGEFCFRFNRRHGEGRLFKMLNACMPASSGVTYEELASPAAT